jgi:hypothetical protein
MLKQLSINEDKERKQVMAQNGSYGFVGNPLIPPWPNTEVARRQADKAAV